MKNIASAMVKAQQQFGPALKTNTNPHFKTKYADLSACIEAVIDALNSNGIFLMQSSHECERGVSVETVFVHESGETISAGKLTVPAAKQDPQGYGSALTYARRYSLMAACGMAPEDDDGNQATAAKRKQDAAPPAQDGSPEAIAKRLAAGVAKGDALGVCDYLIALEDKDRDAIWQQLDAKTQNKLTAAWPKEPA
ncbi:MAG TPA: ERF family protein [Acidovorax sp.]|nr:ERF family protein [Acidovorax sp.]